MNMALILPIAKIMFTITTNTELVSPFYLITGKFERFENCLPTQACTSSNILSIFNQKR